ncbi:hypothetical protein E4T43_08534 [Aureobasidium subglaciale]|nr:hypothetical protein E4T43_08534 [Aureobasidium subglaciale]
MPGSPEREYLRQLTSVDALHELDSRLESWTEEDPYFQENRFPPPPTDLPTQRNGVPREFDWGRYAVSLERSRQRREETLEKTRAIVQRDNPLRDIHSGLSKRRGYLLDDEFEDDDFQEDLRYNAVAEGIRQTHSARQRRLDLLDDDFQELSQAGEGLERREGEKHASSLKREEEDLSQFAEALERREDEKRAARLAYIRGTSGSMVEEQHEGVPDAVDSYVADPPLPMSQKTKDTQTMDDMSFLSTVENGKATLTIKDPHTQNTTVLKNINLTTVELIAPILAFSFEESRNGPKYTIEDISLTAVLSMLRHIYTFEHYVPTDCLHDQMSVLLHVEIFHLATIYDIASLKTMVKARIFLELELSTSYPGPPQDLCKALAYTYKNLPNENDISKTLAHYCITCFLQHRLNEDELFTTFHYNCRPFQRDLVTILRENRFEDESAPTLIQLPVKTTDLPTRWPAVFDADPQAGFLEDEFDNEVKRRTNISQLDKLKIHFRVTLPVR